MNYSWHFVMLSNVFGVVTVNLYCILWCDWLTNLSMQSQMGGMEKCLCGLLGCFRYLVCLSLYWCMNVHFHLCLTYQISGFTALTNAEHVRIEVSLYPLLINCCIDRLIHCSTGRLLYSSISLLIDRSTGLLLYCSISLLLYSSISLLVYCSVGLLVYWSILLFLYWSISLLLCCSLGLLV